MSEIKVRLSLSVPGAQMISWEEAQKNPKESYDTHRLKVDYEDKKGHKKQETLVIKTRRQRMIKQNIQITRDAYDDMLENAPAGVKGWASMSINQKLHSHFRLIAESLGAKDFHFEILDD